MLLSNYEYAEDSDLDRTVLIFLSTSNIVQLALGILVLANLPVGISVRCHSNLIPRKRIKERHKVSVTLSVSVFIVWVWLWETHLTALFNVVYSVGFRVIIFCIIHFVPVQSTNEILILYTFTTHKGVKRWTYRVDMQCLNKHNISLKEISNFMYQPFAYSFCKCK